MAFHPNWNILATADFSWKRFVKEGITPNKEHNEAKKYITGVTLSGEETKRIYEEVISEPSHNTTNTINSNATASDIDFKPSKIRKEGNFRDKEKLINSLMKEATRNNVQGLSDLLCDSSDINVTDQFGWTMLMCAAHAGAIDVVRYLVNEGANVHIKDRRGKNCKSLAKCQSHIAILQVLESHSQGLEKNTIDINDPSDSCGFYCEICKQKFNDICLKQHNSSTVHLFNCHPRYYPTLYSIPENNKGYQLLVKGGWDKEKGLGPEGSGHKFPLKTVLKRDREGLGSYKGIPRVTHFAPLATEAVRVERRSLGKRRREANIERERRKERALRRELS